MKLELAMLVGPESKQFLASLTKQIDRLEALAAKLPNGETDEIEEGVNDDEDDEEVAPKKAAKKKASAPDDDDGDEEDNGDVGPDEDDDSDDSEVDEDSAEDDDEDSDEDEEPVKAAKGKAKAKKFTNDDCNDAAKELCKALGGKAGRAKVLALMKKHFDTESVSELKPEQYEKFVDVMGKATAKAKG